MRPFADRPHRPDAEPAAVLPIADHDAGLDEPERPCPYCAARAWRFDVTRGGQRRWICGYCYPRRTDAAH